MFHFPIAPPLGLVDTGSTDGCKAASNDDTTQAALNTLHSVGYDHSQALTKLLECPLPERVGNSFFSFKCWKKKFSPELKK